MVVQKRILINLHRASKCNVKHQFKLDTIQM